MIIFLQNFLLEVIEFHILRIEIFNSSNADDKNTFSIPYIIDQTSSIGERAGELGAHLGVLFQLIFGSSSRVGIKYSPNSFLISFWKPLKEIFRY